MTTASRESSLWIWLNRAKPIYKRGLHMCRVENSAIVGMADVEGCLRGSQFWIELKCSARPSNPDTDVHVRFEDGQIPWLTRRFNAGGRTFVLLQVAQGQRACRYLVPGHFAHLLDSGLTEEEICALSVLQPKTTAPDVVRAAAR